MCSRCGWCVVGVAGVQWVWLVCSGCVWYVVGVVCRGVVGVVRSTYTTYTYVHTYVHTHTYVRMCVCTYVFMYVRMYVQVIEKFPLCNCNTHL